MAATTQALQRRPPRHSVATHQKKRFIRIPQRAKFVQSESGSLILQPRRKRSIVVIDPPICIPSTPPFVDSKAVRQGIRTRGGWVSPESPVFLEPRRAQIES
jgi:hypothetical protein